MPKIIAALMLQYQHEAPANQYQHEALANQYKHEALASESAAALARIWGRPPAASLIRCLTR